MDTDARSDTVTDAAPSAATPAPGATVAATTAGATTADKIDTLHAKHFAGSRLGHDTELWNLVRRFADEVKALVSEAERTLETTFGAREPKV